MNKSIHIPIWRRFETNRNLFGTSRLRLRFPVRVWPAWTACAVWGFVALFATQLVSGQTSHDGAPDSNAWTEHLEPALGTASPLSLNSPLDEAFLQPWRTVEVAFPESGIVHAIHVQLGDKVSSGQLLFELDQSVLVASRRMIEAKLNATGRREAAEVEWVRRQARYEKIQQLQHEGAANPEEVLRAKTDALIAKHELAAIDEDLALARLELDRLDAQIRARQIFSPIDGIVVEIQKEVGEYLSISEPMMARVVDLNRLKGKFHLPVPVAQQLQVGNQLEMFLPESNSTALARVQYIAPLTQPETGRVEVELVIDNSSGTIRAGQRCRIVRRLEHQTTLLPYRR